METFSLLFALCEGNPPASGMELWSVPEQAFEQTIRDAGEMAPIKWNEKSLNSQFSLNLAWFSRLNFIQK